MRRYFTPTSGQTGVVYRSHRSGLRRLVVPTVNNILRTRLMVRINKERCAVLPFWRSRQHHSPHRAVNRAAQPPAHKDLTSTDSAFSQRQLAPSITLCRDKFGVLKGTYRRHHHSAARFCKALMTLLSLTTLLPLLDGGIWQHRPHAPRRNSGSRWDATSCRTV